MTAPRILFSVAVCVWGLAEFILNVRRTTVAGGRDADRGSRHLLGIFIVGGLAAGSVAWRTVPVHLPLSIDVAAAAGTALIAIGATFRFWAVATLGRFFTTTVMTQSGQTVIRNGPYRVVRHPSYLGGLVGMAGIGVGSDNWLSLAAIVLIPAIAVLVRIRVEEGALEAALGSAYGEYMRESHRLIPGVW